MKSGWFIVAGVGALLASFASDKPAVARWCFAAAFLLFFIGFAFDAGML